MRTETLVARLFPEQAAISGREKLISALAAFAAIAAKAASAEISFSRPLIAACSGKSLATRVSVRMASSCKWKMHPNRSRPES